MSVALRARKGFTLITTLWIMAAASIVSAAAAVAGRESFEAARNRVAAERAYWRANDCVERALATIDDILSTESDDFAARAWRHLDRSYRASPPSTGDACSSALHAIGEQVAVNAADELQLRTLFRAAGLANPDALTAALLDWRDLDDDPRPGGAEGDWYANQQRVRPRNGPFADVREIALVRGFESVTGVDELLSVELAPIALNSAPAAVLSSVPGFTPELVDRLMEDRAAGHDVLDVLALASSLSESSRRELLMHFPEVARLTTPDPVSWLLTARSAAGAPRVASTIELRLVRSGTRAIALRRRSW